MTEPTNPYAFSGPTYNANGRVTYQEGMELRDWFASMALITMTLDAATSARAAYEIADAMLIERAK